MNKRIILMFILVVGMLTSTRYVKAEEKNAYISCSLVEDSLNFRDAIDGNVVKSVTCGHDLVVIDDTLGSSNICNNWYKIRYENNEYYACGDWITIKKEISPEDKTKYIEQLKDLGFPDSYIDSLVDIHVNHPTWQFRTFNTNLDWKTVISNESVKGRNLVYRTFNEGYRSKEPYSYNWQNDEFYRHSTETNWWYASPEAIEYYMDPRNFLDEKSIFMFEALSYQPTFQTDGLIKKIMDDSFMPSTYKKYFDTSYTEAFLDGANKYKVSPVHMASRILQENGRDGSISSRGSFEYNGTTYNDVFNFYNIHAYGYNPAVQGLIWAMGGLDGTGTSYGRPWNNPYKSIVGGAEFLSDGYISVGQDTLYFQKFDVSRTNGHYTHQYMQNISAPASEASSTYNAYSKISGLLDESLVFIIPLYNNMPSTRVSAPQGGNPNYYLSDIKIDDTSIDNFKYDTLTYNYNTTKDKINITTKTINSNATVTGTGTINLNNGNNKIDIIVTAENGNKKTYTLNILKESNNEDIVLSSNNNLKELSIDKIKFDFNKDILEYNLEVDYDIDKIVVNYVMEDDKASATGNKNINLLVGENTINITVKAEDGSTKTYIIKILRKDITLKEILDNSGIKYNKNNIYGIKIGTELSSLITNIKNISKDAKIEIKNSDNELITKGIFATGYSVTISINEESRTFNIVLYGDINGDGIIDKIDYLQVLRHYYKYITLDGAYLEAADANKDGEVTKLDYLAILRDYYGYAKIDQ